MRLIDEQREVEALAALGLTNAEIARRTGVHRSTVANWRAGRTPCRSGDSSCERCGALQHDPAALPREKYLYLLGQYLGDGHIQAFPRGVHKLAISCAADWPGILHEVMNAVDAVLPQNKVNGAWKGTSLCVDVYSYSKQWPCLFPQAGPGRKHERPIVLAGWQEELVMADPRPLLRGLIHSDGCRAINRVRAGGREYSYPRYLFSNESQDIRELFQWGCELVGAESRHSRHNVVSVARRDSVALLDTFIGPKS